MVSKELQNELLKILWSGTSEDFKHMKWPLSDIEAEAVLSMCRAFPLGENAGLIVIRLNGKTQMPESYWDHCGHQEEPFDVGQHTEYPMLYRTMKRALARRQKMENDPVDDRGGVVLAFWRSPDWRPSDPRITKYCEIGSQVPGSPRQ